jgi:hypothetical protein
MEPSASTDWECVLQFVADPLDLSFASKTTETAVLQTGDNLQVPTPPVRLIFSCSSLLLTSGKSYPMTARP